MIFSSVILLTYIRPHYSDEGVQHQHFPGASLPRIPGHEIVGDIVAVHSREKTFKIGERVGGGWHGGHCFTCQYCRVGDFTACEKEAINGSFVLSCL